jgi:hypothetical protein
MKPSNPGYNSVLWDWSNLCQNLDENALLHEQNDSEMRLLHGQSAVKVRVSSGSVVKNLTNLHIIKDSLIDQVILWLVLQSSCGAFY